MAHGPKLTAFAERVVYLKAWSKTFRHFILALPDWITPNRVTMFRAALAVPLFWTLSVGRYWTAAAVFTVAMALDAVDGAIAHIKSMETPSGAFLDPLADKLILCAALAAVWNALPAWILIVTGGTLLYAAAITLQRISKMLRTRGISGPALAQSVAAKPAGKVKTMFDVLAAMLVIAGLALGSPAVINAGGAAIVVGSILAVIIHFSPAGRVRSLHPAGRKVA